VQGICWAAYKKGGNTAEKQFQKSIEAALRLWLIKLPVYKADVTRTGRE
jgi:hypothetical protein